MHACMHMGGSDGWDLTVLPGICPDVGGNSADPGFGERCKAVGGTVRFCSAGFCPARVGFGQWHAGGVPISGGMDQNMEDGIADQNSAATGCQQFCGSCFGTIDLHVSCQSRDTEPVTCCMAFSLFSVLAVVFAVRRSRYQSSQPVQR